MRREPGPGRACSVGAVRQRRRGQEHHHHRVGAGSQACRQEGEQVAEHLLLRRFHILVIVFKKLQMSLQFGWMCTQTHVNTWPMCPPGWHPGRWPLWAQHPPDAECRPAWCAPVWLRVGACLYWRPEKPRPHVYRLPAGRPWWSSGVEGAEENRYVFIELSAWLSTIFGVVHHQCCLLLNHNIIMFHCILPLN